MGKYSIMITTKQKRVSDTKNGYKVFEKRVSEMYKNLFKEKVLYEKFENR
jgi:hypothetical protein